MKKIGVRSLLVPLLALSACTTNVDPVEERTAETSEALTCELGSYATCEVPLHVHLLPPAKKCRCLWNDPGLIREIAAGARSTYAIDGAGRIFAWGSNEGFALGNGSTYDEVYPVFNQIGWGEHLAAGGTGACALSKGKVSCWGTVVPGSVTYPKPTAIAGFPADTVVSTIVHGRNHACALTTDATVWCWGDNSLGQLADPSSLGRATAARVKDPSWNVSNNVLQLAAAGNATCALVDDGAAGSVWCWGDNARGSLGTGTGGNDAATDHTAVPQLAAKGGFQMGADALVGGGDGTFCAFDVKSQSTLCWGANDQGQAGTNVDGQAADKNDKAAPFPATLVPPHEIVAFGAHHTCVGGGDNDKTGVMCFGANGAGQLGNASNVSSLLSVSPQFEPQSSFYIKERFSGLAAGESHTCALLTSTVSGIYCWGSNARSQLGGTGAGSNVPRSVPWSPPRVPWEKS